MNGMVFRPRHGLSLCAGGGGLDMGLMLAEPGYHTRCFVEWEDWPRAVLIAAQRAGYFAPAPIWTDLRTFDARPFCGAFDIVLAGYPCQPFSAAGKRGGADDPRHLWPDVARVIGECRPEWIFLENVAGHVTLGLETVLRELWGMGYTPAAGLFSAAEVGAPHQRLRIFILAHTDEPASGHGSLQPGREQRLYPEGRGAGAGHHQLVDAEGHGWREGRSGPELWIRRDTPPACASGAMADPGGAELEGQQRGQCDAGGWQIPHGHPALPGRTGLHPPGPGDHDAWRRVLAARPDLAPALGFDDCLAWARRLAADPEGSVAAAAEPALRRMADGLAHRARALRLLGNGVHPLASAYAWRSLAAAHGLGPVDLAVDRSGPAPCADGFP
ncbi:DNA cytosine methyltransferase [Roseinatronobacter bogoriensis subsp. barguzinensis]|uniref:DNA (cytosine-5-)-methyltransferase n=1 Tax=Roseinatronobacter bogoriensis subsp. barguzinensis TaxID=441209 RepID=A0A2K8K7X5_9RHOB|nr:DNA cytosine methyltransferase [Rhodobaca barguzinensis]